MTIKLTEREAIGMSGSKSIRARVTANKSGRETKDNQLNMRVIKDVTVLFFQKNCLHLYCKTVKPPKLPKVKTRATISKNYVHTIIYHAP